MIGSRRHVEWGGKRYQVSDLVNQARQYSRRAEWSVACPEEYEFAMMCDPSGAVFAECTKHMKKANSAFLYRR